MKATTSHEPHRSVILFDGDCNLCNASVRFVLRRDARARFHFASLDSPYAEAHLGPPQSRRFPESVVLIEAGRIYDGSTAALRIARGLRFPWFLLAAFLVIPRPLRDAVYRFIAVRRTRWFGRSDTCPIGAERERYADRFLDES